jgi:drug/metabolite transporter (DMT)-like permease
MVAATAAFTMNDAITKTVASEMNFGQLMLVRGLFAMVMVSLLAYQQNALRSPRTLLVRPVALRVLGEVGGTTCFLAAIVHLPLANVAAIFQALPLAITLGAALVLREHVGWRRWLAIVIGFIGVLIIVRPGLAGFSEFSLFALMSVCFSALRDLATRRIPATIPTLFITLLTTFTVTGAGAVMLVPLGGWRPISAPSLSLIALAALLVMIGYQCVIIAMRTGEVAAVAPFRYTSLLWATLLGYLLFSDVPDGPMLVGAAIIVASGLYTFYRERQLGLKQQASAAGPPPDGL